MANAKRDFIVEKVKEVLAAPSCCPELKDAAQKYLAALDTADEKAAGKILIAELEEDVQSIDDTLAFFCSDAAKEIFGAETAANMAETREKLKRQGPKSASVRRARQGRQFWITRKRFCNNATR